MNLKDFWFKVWQVLNGPLKSISPVNFPTTVYKWVSSLCKQSLEYWIKAVVGKSLHSNNG